MNTLKFHKTLIKYSDALQNLLASRPRNISTSLCRQQSFQSNGSGPTSRKNAVLYTLSGVVIMAGFTYAAVPLYKMFCESTGYETKSLFKEISDEELKIKMKKLKRSDTRQINVNFVANTSSDLNWSFEPQQAKVTLAVGETSLAFYRAKNRTR
jgi:cytochrome c oxidase assembly protein subunit 11